MKITCKSCGGPATRTSRSGLCRKCFLRPMPADFAEIAPTKYVAQLMAHYHSSETTVKRWLSEAGAQPKPFKAEPVLSIPDDFADRAPMSHTSALARHYGVAPQTVTRWATSLGIAIPPYAKPGKADPPRVSRLRPFVYNGPKAPYIPPRDGSLHGSAAEHLRRYAAVYRCREKGSADPNGEFYRYGNTVLTPDELLIRAQRRGWEARA